MVGDGPAAEGSGPEARLAALAAITAVDTGVVTAGISNVGSEVRKCGGGNVPSPVGKIEQVMWACAPLTTNCV